MTEAKLIAIAVAALALIAGILALQKHEQDLGAAKVQAQVAADTLAQKQALDAQQRKADTHAAELRAQVASAARDASSARDRLRNAERAYASSHSSAPGIGANPGQAADLRPGLSDGLEQALLDMGGYADQLSIALTSCQTGGGYQVNQ